MPGVLGLDSHTVANKKDMAMLGRPAPPDLSEDATEEERMHQKGGPLLFPDVRGKRKTGARIGHFYFGLSTKTKEMMNTHRKDLAKNAAKAALAEADAIQKEIQKEENTTTTTKPKKRRGSTLGAIVNSSNKETLTATQQFLRVVKQQTTAAAVLQRIFRRNVSVTPTIYNNYLKRLEKT